MGSASEKTPISVRAKRNFSPTRSRRGVRMITPFDKMSSILESAHSAFRAPDVSRRGG